MPCLALWRARDAVRGLRGVREPGVLRERAGRGVEVGSWSTEQRVEGPEREPEPSGWGRDEGAERGGESETEYRVSRG